MKKQKHITERSYIYMKYIIYNINRMAGKYTPHQVFADWVEMSALSIAQSVEPNKEREDDFFTR